jgi:hypothetical protein
VGRVGDHDVGLGDVLHHPPARRLDLEAPDLRLHFRASLALLVLLLDLLFAHLQVLVVLPALVGVVAQGDEQEGDRHAQRKRVKQRPQRGQQDLGRARGQGDEVDEAVADAGVNDPADDAQLEDRLERLDHAVDADQPLQSGQGVELGRVRNQRLRGPQKADLGEAGQHPGQHARQGHDPDRHGEGAQPVPARPRHLLHAAARGARAQKVLVGRGERAAQVVEQVAAGRARVEHEQHHEQRDRAGKLGRTGDLPLFARLLQPARCGLLGLFLAVVAAAGHEFTARWRARRPGARAGSGASRWAGRG